MQYLLYCEPSKGSFKGPSSYGTGKLNKCKNSLNKEISF